MTDKLVNNKRGSLSHSNGLGDGLGIIAWMKLLKVKIPNKYLLDLHSCICISLYIVHFKKSQALWHCPSHICASQKQRFNQLKTADNFSMDLMEEECQISKHPCLDA